MAVHDQQNGTFASTDVQAELQEAKDLSVSLKEQLRALQDEKVKTDEHASDLIRHLSHGSEENRKLQLRNEDHCLGHGRVQHSHVRSQNLSLHAKSNLHQCLHTSSTSVKLQMPWSCLFRCLVLNCTRSVSHKIVARFSDADCEAFMKCAGPPAGRRW